jgi:hypothetical protein
MAINQFGNEIQAIIEQQNFLDQKYLRSLKPTYVFRAVAKKRPMQANIGETKTFTRSAEIAPNATPYNPASNTGLDNGITPDARTFEQWIAGLNEWNGGLDLNIKQAQTLIPDLFLDNTEKLASKAGNSLELVAAGVIASAYGDYGDTFGTTIATTATTIHVDNVVGFKTQYPAGNAPSLGLPLPVSSGNKLPIIILDGTTGAFKAAANVEGFTVDVSNTSYMQSPPNISGQSGTLLLDAAVSMAVGDRVVSMDVSASTSSYNSRFKDGSVVVRPINPGNGKRYATADAMVATATFNPSSDIPYAVSILKRRQVPKMRNGLYACGVDSTLLQYLYNDPGFQRATMGTFDKSPVFTDGIIAKGWGVEFVEASQIPVYVAPAGGFNLRHAFVFGNECVEEYPWEGSMQGVNKIAGVGDTVDIRWADQIEFITQAPLDRKHEVIKQTYVYQGDFQPPTDKSSTPAIIQSTDLCRYKRCVEIQSASDA